MILDEASVKIWLTLIRKFLETYEWLSSAFVLDHFVQSHWQNEKLPSSWKTYLTQLSPSELGTFIATGQSRHTPPPLSLQCFRKTTRILSLDRTFQPPYPAGDTDPMVMAKMLKLLNRHVKPKKQHEITHLSAVIQELSAKSGNIKNLIDIGSGLGHLCRYMSYGLSFNTIGIDSDPKLAVTAKIFNQQIEMGMKHCVDQLDQQTEKATSEHMNKFITRSDKICQDGKFGIIGLHGCGDLGAIVVENFVKNEEIRFLAFVSCCYQKIDKCFPLSAFMKDNPLILQYESLELACHAKELYASRLKDMLEVDKLKVHCYRAAVETLLVKHGLVRAGLKGVKNSHLLDFPEYAIRATQNLDVRLSSEELESESISKMLSEWMLVVIFYTLRVLLAPVIESAILLDRALLILENGIHTEIKPIFDALLSPRNLCLIGWKKD